MLMQTKVMIQAQTAGLAIVHLELQAAVDLNMLRQVTLVAMGILYHLEIQALALLRIICNHTLVFMFGSVLHN